MARNNEIERVGGRKARSDLQDKTDKSSIGRDLSEVAKLATTDKSSIGRDLSEVAKLATTYKTRQTRAALGVPCRRSHARSDLQEGSDSIARDDNRYSTCSIIIVRIAVETIKRSSSIRHV